MIYTILQHPDKRLKEKGETVTKFDDELKEIVKNMFETHYAQKNCAALAATQLGIPLRITVIDFSDDKDSPLCLINPEVIESKGNETSQEGCMSVLGVYAKVSRPNWVKVRYQDVDGNTHEVEADGFMAKCMQHEIDHLNGKLYLDHLSTLKRKMLELKLRKVKK